MNTEQSSFSSNLKPTGQPAGQPAGQSSWQRLGHRFRRCAKPVGVLASRLMLVMLALGTANPAQAADPLPAAAAGVSSTSQFRAGRAIRRNRADSKKISYSVQCQVYAILARKAPVRNEPRIPKSLSFLKREFADDHFAVYKHFQLLDQRSLKLSAQASTDSANFRTSGHKMELKLKDTNPKRFRLHVRLSSSRARKTLVDVDYSAAKGGGVVMYVGGQHADGRMIFATQCRAR